MPLLLVSIFPTLVPYQGVGAHVIFQVTIINAKMPLQSYLPPLTVSRCQRNLPWALLRARMG